MDLKAELGEFSEDCPPVDDPRFQLLFLFLERELSSDEKNHLISCLPVAPPIAQHMVQSRKLLIPPGKGQFMERMKAEEEIWRSEQALLVTILETQSWGTGLREKWNKGLKSYQAIEQWPLSVLRNTLLAYLSLQLEQPQLAISALRELYNLHPLERNRKKSIALLPSEFKRSLFADLERLNQALLVLLPENEKILFQLFWQRYTQELTSKDFKQKIRDAFSVLQLRDFAFTYNWGLGVPHLWVDRLFRLRTLQLEKKYLLDSERYLGSDQFLRTVWWMLEGAQFSTRDLGFLQKVWTDNLSGEQLHLVLALGDKDLKQTLGERDPELKRPLFLLQRDRLKAYRKHPSLWPIAWVQLYDLGDFDSKDLSLFASP